MIGLTAVNMNTRRSENIRKVNKTVWRSDKNKKRNIFKNGKTVSFKANKNSSDR